MWVVLCFLCEAAEESVAPVSMFAEVAFSAAWHRHVYFRHVPMTSSSHPVHILAYIIAMPVFQVPLCVIERASFMPASLGGARLHIFWFECPFGDAVVISKPLSCESQTISAPSKSGCNHGRVCVWGLTPASGCLRTK